LTALAILISMLLSCSDSGNSQDTTDGDQESAQPDGDEEPDIEAESDGDFDAEPDLDTDGDGEMEGETTEVDNEREGETTENETEAEQAPHPGENLVLSVNPENYLTDLTFIAQERLPGSDHWQAVQDLCATRLGELGYTVERHEYGTGVNVIGRKPGSGDNPADVILSAHYDHIAGCAGADDNGSGVAALFEAARILATASFENNLVLACWDEEERGLIGSLAYADRAKQNGDVILGSLVFETMAYTDDAPNSQTMPWGFDLLWPDMAQWLTDRENRGDFIAVIADEKARAASASLEYWAAFVDLPLTVIELTDSQKNSSVFNDMRRSDHAAFWKHDYPALMLTDTANFRNPYYHCHGGPDTIDTLDLPFAHLVTAATIGAAIDLLVLAQD
jgi:hypothetical protein